MGVIDQILAAIDNQRRVLGRNLQDWYTDPSGSLSKTLSNLPQAVQDFGSNPTNLVGGLGTMEGALSVLSPVRPQLLRLSPKLLRDLPDYALKGGTQPLSGFLNQLAGKPGVKRSALDQLYRGADLTQKVAPSDVGALAQAPKLYTQQGAQHLREMDRDALEIDLAMDNVMGPRFAQERRQHMLDTLADHPVSRDDLAYMHHRDTNESMWTERLESLGLYDEYYDRMMDGLMDRAMAVTQQSPRMTQSFTPLFEEYQRQPWAAQRNGQYFESVLRGAPSTASSLPTGHFSNPAQLGHIRGNVVDTPQGPSVMLEELQSDSLRKLGSKDPRVQGVYGNLGRMAMDRSAAAGATELLIPDGARIGEVRDASKLPFYQDLYDKTLGKELYQPMAERGVPVDYDNGFWRIGLPQRIRDAIQSNSGILDYKRGGLVACGK